MITTFMKYLCVAFTSGVIYAKIVNIKIDNIHYLLLVPLATLSGISFMFFHWLDPEIGIQSFFLISILLLNMFYIVKHRVKTDVSVIASTIAMVMSYILYVIATLMMSPLMYFFLQYELTAEKYDLINFFMVLFVCALQYLFGFIIFRIKRLRNGIPALTNHKDHEMGMFVCILVFTIVTIFSSRGAKSSDIIIFAALIFIFGMMMLIWWRKRITYHYLSKIKERQYEALIQEIQDKNHHIMKLKEEHDRLSKLIHKDNKLIPTTELLVREYIKEKGEDEKGKEILARLSALYQDRKGILENSLERMPYPKQTGILTVDATLNYMSKRAQTKNINFSVIFDENIQEILKVIQEEDLNTLLSDLIENALHSVDKTKEKSVEVVFGFDGTHTIEIRDSGIPFSEEVLAHLGQKEITTRKNAGGSGIGLITTIQILTKYQASFYILDQNLPHPFTKTILLRFDKENNIHKLEKALPIKP